jgi:hypothetical protein
MTPNAIKELATTGPKLSKRAEPDRGDRCERRLEYHVEYLMVFRASNAPGRPLFKLRGRCCSQIKESHMSRALIARVMTAVAITACLQSPAAQAQERDLKFVLDFISLGRHAPWYVERVISKTRG